MLIAREYTKSDEKKLIDMINEIKNIDNNFEGLSNIKNIENYESFLNILEKNKNQDLINPEYSPQTTFGVFEGDRLIGGFNLRHILKGNLINNGGNIGYLIRPSERKKEYGSLLLSLALNEAKKIGLEKVLISCKQENVASEKVIISNGGIYEDDYYDKTTKETYKRFWIKL